MKDEKINYIFFKNAATNNNYIKKNKIKEIDPFTICVEKTYGLDWGGEIEACDKEKYEYAIREKWKGSRVKTIDELYLLKLPPYYCFIFKSESEAKDAKDKLLENCFHIKLI